MTTLQFLVIPSDEYDEYDIDTDEIESEYALYLMDDHEAFSVSLSDTQIDEITALTDHKQESAIITLTTEAPLTWPYVKVDILRKSSMFEAYRCVTTLVRDRDHTERLTPRVYCCEAVHRLLGENAAPIGARFYITWELAR